MSALRTQEVECVWSKSLRILVIDDEPSIRNLLVEYLVEEGYAVYGAGTLTEAATRMAAGMPDLILLDLMLPGESGWDFLRARAADASLAKVPVLVVSAAPPNQLVEVNELGADGVLSKPFDLEVLSATVKSIVS